MDYDWLEQFESDMQTVRRNVTHNVNCMEEAVAESNDHMLCFDTCEDLRNALQCLKDALEIIKKYY